MKKNMFYIILVGLISILGLSYSIFITDSRKVTTSELLVGNLTYGLNIYEDNSYTPISGTSVTIPANTSKEYYITVFSTNPVSSKFTLAYNNSNVTVEVSSRSGWNPSGLINEYSSSAFSKTIKVKVNNNTNSSQTVDFQAFGGYSFNAVSSINLGNGYYSVINTYNEAFTLEGELLTDIVKDDTNCIPTASEPCLYGGDSTVNYFKFDEDSNDVYRVVGNYLVNGEVLTKIIGPASTDDNINSTTTLSSADYQKIGGSSSYLGSNYASLSVYYLNSDVKVMSNGTSTTPYYIPEVSADINFVAYEYTGSGAGESSFDDYMAKVGKEYYASPSLSCSEGTVGTFDNKTKNIVFTSVSVPASCTIVFNDRTYADSKLATHVIRDNYLANISEIGQRTSFDNVYVDSDTTFFKTNNAELGETVYYFAGANASVNNWVIFGTCKSSTYNCTVGHDLYWRIIRTNEETTGGGVRLLYAGSGSKTVNNKKVIADNVINATISTSDTTFSNSSSNKTRRYLGYTFGSADDNLSTIRGTTGQSAVKTLIEQWYATQFPTSTDSSLRARISTKAVYCNDRSTNSVASTTTSFGSKTINHGAYLRVYNNNSNGRNPSYACGAKITGYDANSTWYYTGGNDNADRYTGESYTYGNGFLSNAPVALMTADEISFAGGKYNDQNASLWYYANKEGNSITGNVYWWTLSPYYSNSSSARVFYVRGNSSNPGALNSSNVYNTSRVRPVLSLDSDTLWLQGDGTASDPYRIVEN